MPPLNANMRALNSYAESVKLHNLYFIAFSQRVPQASQKRQIQARLKKVGRRSRGCPRHIANPVEHFFDTHGKSLNL